MAKKTTKLEVAQRHLEETRYKLMQSEIMHRYFELRMKDEEKPWKDMEAKEAAQIEESKKYISFLEGIVTEYEKD